MSLDPQVRDALPQFFGTEDPPPDDVVLAARDRQQRLAAHGPTVVGEVSSRDEMIVGDDNEVPVRVYTPRDPAGPAFVAFHGGGWVSGSVSTWDVIWRAFAARLAATVVSVDYRLAPEHRFPAALDDAWLAARTVVDEADRFGAGDGVVVGGDSAGGALAAAVARRARDAGLELAGQALIYPVLDPPANRESYRTFDRGFGLTAAAMGFYWSTYLGRADGDSLDAAPLRTADLHGLAPAVVVTAECDILRDEGEEYAHRLRAAGVPVASCRCDGLVHGFLRIAGEVDAAGAGFDRITDLMAEMFGYRRPIASD